MDIEIQGIEWDAWNEDHIAAHGISPTDVEEVCGTRREFLDRERRGES